MSGPGVIIDGVARMVDGQALRFDEAGEAPCCCEFGGPTPPRTSPCCSKCPPRPMCYPLESPAVCNATTDGVDALLFARGRIRARFESDQRARGFGVISSDGDWTMPKQTLWGDGTSQPGCFDCNDSIEHAFIENTEIPVFDTFQPPDPVEYSRYVMSGQTLIAPCGTDGFGLGTCFAGDTCDSTGGFRYQTVQWKDPRSCRTQLNAFYGFAGRIDIDPNFATDVWQNGFSLMGGWMALDDGSIVPDMGLRADLRCPEPPVFSWTAINVRPSIDYFSRAGCVTGAILRLVASGEGVFGMGSPSQGDVQRFNITAELALGLNNVASCAGPEGGPRRFPTGIPDSAKQEAAFGCRGCGP